MPRTIEPVRARDGGIGLLVVRRLLGQSVSLGVSN